VSSLDLGVIGNCAVASLIERKGRHAWRGLGRLDGDPVFNALLGGDESQAGFMDVLVAGARGGRQRYLHNTAILETTIEGNGGTVRLIDFAPRFRRFGRMFRSPMLVRRLEPVAGRPRVTVRLRPTFDYGARRAELTSGSNHACFVGDSAVLRLTADASINHVLHETELSFDRPVNLIVGADESVTDNPDTLIRSFLAETETYWQAWVRDLNIPFDWQQAVIRAASMSSRPAALVARPRPSRRCFHGARLRYDGTGAGQGAADALALSVRVRRHRRQRLGADRLLVDRDGKHTEKDVADDRRLLDGDQRTQDH
jgi:hypothetical protein